jgi:hypothetical protein
MNREEFKRFIDEKGKQVKIEDIGGGMMRVHAEQHRYRCTEDEEGFKWVSILKYFKEVYAYPIDWQSIANEILEFYGITDD